MELRQKLLELTAEDGPNIPARTLAIYCGVSSTTLIQYKNGKVGLSKTLYEQMERGLREYAALVTEITK